MKKIAVALSLILALAACKLPSYTIGMSEAEFKSKHKWTAQVAAQTTNLTVYKVEANFQDDKRKHYQYFYFESGKLIRLDEGQAMSGI